MNTYLRIRIGFLFSLFLLCAWNTLWAQCSLEGYTVDVSKDENSCNQSSIDVSIDVKKYDDNFLNCYWKVSVRSVATGKSARSSSFDETGEAGTLGNLAQGSYYLEFEDESGEQVYYWDGGTGFTANAGNRGEITIHDEYVTPIIQATDNVSPSCFGTDEEAEITLRITNKEVVGDGFTFEIYGEGVESQSSGKVQDTEYTFSGIESGKEVFYKITDYSCGVAVTTTGRHSLHKSPVVAKANQIRYYFKRDCENGGYSMQVGIRHDSKILDDQIPGQLELTISGETFVLDPVENPEVLIEKQSSLEYRYEIPTEKNPNPGDIISASYMAGCLDKPLPRNNYKIEDFNDEVLYKADGYQEEANCNFEPQLFLNGTMSPNTRTYYDMVCEGTDIKVYQEDPPESGDFTELEYLSSELEGVQFIGGDSKRKWPGNDFAGDRSILLTDQNGNPLDLPDGGNFMVELIKDGDYEISKLISLPEKPKGEDQLKSLTVEPTYSLLEESGGFSIKLKFEDDIGKSIYPRVRVRVTPSTPTSITSDKCTKKGSNRYECTYEGPPGLGGTYEYNFPIEFEDTPTKDTDDIKISDLPEGEYNIVIIDPCSGKPMKINGENAEISKKIKKNDLAQYSCTKAEEDSNYSCVDIIRKCSGVDVEYSLYPIANANDNGISHKFTDGYHENLITNNRMDGTFVNAPSSGKYDIEMRGAGRDFHSAVNTNENRAKRGDDPINKEYGQYIRRIIIPVDIDPPVNLTPSVTYFCYIADNDEKRAQIEVDIDRGTILYPLYYELLDKDGNPVIDEDGNPMTRIIEEGGDLYWPFKDLDVHTVIDNESEPIPKIYKIRIINEYDENTGTGCSSNTYDITRFNCPEIANIEITKKGVPEQEFIDGKHEPEIKFIIAVKNYGPERSTFNYVRDLVPEGYSITSPIEPEKGTYYETGDDKGVWDIGPIEIGETVELVLEGVMKKGKEDIDYLNKANFTSLSRPRRDSDKPREAEAEIERLYHMFKVNPALMNHNPEKKTQSPDP